MTWKFKHDRSFFGKVCYANDICLYMYLTNIIIYLEMKRKTFYGTLFIRLKKCTNFKGTGLLLYDLFRYSI